MAAVLIESLSSLIAVIGIKEIGYFSVPLFLLNLETYLQLLEKILTNLRNLAKLSETFLNYA